MGLPLSLPDLPPGYAFVVDENGDFVVDELGRYVIAPALPTPFRATAVLALDAAYGSSTVVRKFPLPEEPTVTVRNNVAVLLSLDTTFPIDTPCSIAFRKPNGTAFKVPGAVGRNQTATHIGTLIAQGYAGGNLASSDLNQTGPWQAWFSSNALQGPIAEFTVRA